MKTKLAKYSVIFLVGVLLPIGNETYAIDQTDAEYNRAKQAARETIQRYEEAVRSGNPDRIRNATLEVQADPLAVQEVNKTKSNAWKKNFNDEIGKIQSRAKEIARSKIAEKLGVKPEDVSTFEATNPRKIDPKTGEVIQKVGQDWDYTARVKGKDVKVADVKQIVHDAYHEAATGEKPPSPQGMTEAEYKTTLKDYQKKASQTAHRQALEVLNSTSDEAYGGAVSEGERILSGPRDQRVRDAKQLSEVIEHKSNIAARAAEKLRAEGETNKAIGYEMEQFRQADKQIQKQVYPRVEARGGTVPDHLKTGAEIIRKVAEGEISPSQGRAELAKMGETGETMIRKNAELFEASQTLESPSEVLKRAKNGQTPPDVLTENVKNSLEIKRAKARSNEPKSLLAGGKSSFQGDTPPPEYQPSSTLDQVREKAEAVLQSEKLRTGQSINRPKSTLDGGKASVGTAETPVVKGSELAEAANADKGLVKSGIKKTTPASGGQAAGAVSESALVEAASEAASRQAANTGGQVNTKIRGPSAQNTNPGGQLEAMGVPDNRPTLTPEQAGVQIRGKVDPLSPEGLNKTKWVQDPDLAKLSNPRGQDLGKAPEGHKGLGDYAKGKGEALDKGRMKTIEERVPGRLMTPQLEEMAATGNRPPSLLEGGKASSSYIPSPPSKIAQLDQAVGGRIQETIGMGEIPESSSQLRKGFTEHGDKAMAAVAVAATAYEGLEAGKQYGEGWEAWRIAVDYRNRALKAREAGNFTVADKLDKRAEEYEAETSQKMSQGLLDEAKLVGTLGVAATATGGVALAGYGAYKTGEASYGAAKGLSERMIEEEYAREVANAQREGRAANDGIASANAKARIVGEVTGMRAGMERIMRDTEADQAAVEMDEKLKGRRDNAILDMDDGLHEINLIEQRMRDLDKNPNQDDPWVRQRREELLDAYTTKRDELQRTNRTLGADAGAGDGEAIAIRGAVSLIPEIPDYRRDEGEVVKEVADAIRRDEPKGIDDLAGAMVDNQTTAEEQAQWQDQGFADPNNPAWEAVRDFTGTNAAGYSETEQTMIASARISRSPDRVDKVNIEEERRKTQEQEIEADLRRADQRRTDEERFTNDWNSTISGINDSLSDIDKRDAQKVRDMTEAAIKMIQQMQNGTLSDENFTTQMATLEREQVNLEREGREGWQKIRDRLMGEQVNPGSGGGSVRIGGGVSDACANNFTMTDGSTMKCLCPGYEFDYSAAICMNAGGGAGAGGVTGAGATGAAAASAILGSVPQDQLDIRNVQCNTKSQSGGDTPASITVSLGGTTGTANIRYSLYSVKDRIIVMHRGASVLDTGCTNGSSSVDVPISIPGGQLQIVVQPACDGKGTSWDFTVSCPGGALQ